MARQNWKCYKIKLPDIIAISHSLAPMVEVFRSIYPLENITNTSLILTKQCDRHKFNIDLRSRSAVFQYMTGILETEVMTGENSWNFVDIIKEICLVKCNSFYEAKYKYQGMFETQKVRRHDKFRKEWSQH